MAGYSGTPLVKKRPKKSSGVVTDIDEGYVRRSGLKFVYRTKDR
jgi:hypothetical protein